MELIEVINSIDYAVTKRLKLAGSHFFRNISLRERSNNDRLRFAPLASSAATGRRPEK